LTRLASEATLNVSMATPNRTALSLVATGIVATAVVALLLLRAGREAAVVLSAAGSVASLFGLIIIAIEVLSLRGVAESTRQAVEGTQAEIAASISLADISRALRSIEQVQSFARDGKYELAHMRLQDVRDLLVRLRDNPRFSPSLKPKQFRELLSSVGAELSGLYDSAYDSTTEFDSRRLYQNMERLVIVLVSFENQLRFSRSQSNG
jgi:hypothetical protein